MFSLLSTILFSCKDKVLLFTLDDDKYMGQQMAAEIANDPNYNILPRSGNQEAYSYLEKMKMDILEGGQVKYANEFDWELSILEDDSVLNAFCTPGGYIYVYTGLIKYLDNSSSLAGVMGHEMGHADARHSSKQLQERFGISALLSIISGGNAAAISDIVANLVLLSFSRSDETEADERSVSYLCPTDFEADGAAKFFIKLNDSGVSSPPEFLSTHPNPSNRVENIERTAQDMSCGVEILDAEVNDLDYAEFKALFN